MLLIDELLGKAVSKGASDVHINIGMPPVIRVNTELVVMDMPVISGKIAEDMVLSMLGEVRYAVLREKRDIDFAIMINSGASSRVNAHTKGAYRNFYCAFINNSFQSWTPLNCPISSSMSWKCPRA